MHSFHVYHFSGVSYYGSIEHDSISKHMKRVRILFVSTLLFAGVVITISPAKAVTTEELLQQIQALQQQIQILQDQLKTNQSQSPVVKDGQGPPVATPAVSSQGACPAITRILKKGYAGDDITQLQTYLAKDSSIYPEGLVTGYFGALTEKAVQRWQVKQDIVSSGAPETTWYGLVGPRTRTKLNYVCMEEMNVSETMSLLPPPLITTRPPTQQPPDVSAVFVPHAPKNLKAEAVPYLRMSLLWSPPDNESGITSYRVYRNGSYLINVFGTSY